MEIACIKPSNMAVHVTILKSWYIRKDHSMPPKGEGKEECMATKSGPTLLIVKTVFNQFIIQREHKSFKE